MKTLFAVNFSGSRAERAYNEKRLVTEILAGLRVLEVTWDTWPWSDKTRGVATHEGGGGRPLSEGISDTLKGRGSVVRTY